LRAAGVPVPEAYVAHAVDEENSSEITRKLLSLDPRPDGIFGYNVGAAARAPSDAGMRIPKQIKVIGVGNVHYPHLLRHTLSTIDQGSGLTGQCAAKTLMRHMTSRQRPVRSVLIEPTLIARESTRGE
jgi:LacI family transcriptional regulator